MKYQSIAFSLMLAIGLTLAACGNNNNNDDDDDITTGTPTYADDIKPLITTNCIGCHTGPGASGGIVLSSYTEVKAVTESGQLITAINDASDPMPPSGLMSSARRDLVQRWIDGGYLE